MRSHSLLLTLALSGLLPMCSFAEGSSDSTITKLAPRKLNEVVVTGQYNAQSAKNSVYSVRTISSEMIKLRAATSLMQVLSTETGVRFSNDLTLGTSDISLMGVTGQNVKILLDGVPVLDRGEIREGLGQIDINTIDRIEIVEGPMSVSYGTDALGGVINIITKNGASAEKLQVSLRVQEESAGSEYSGFGAKGIHNQNLNVSWAKNKWSFSGSFSRNDFGGWQGASAGRMLDWNPKDQLLGGLKIGYTSSRFKVWYRINALDETITNYGMLNVNDNTAVDKDYDSKRYFHQAQSDWNISSRLSLSSALSYTDYSRRTRTITLNVLTGDRRLALGQGVQDKSVFTSTFFRTTAQYLLSNTVSLQPGVELNFNGSSGDRIDGSPEINDYSFFISSEIKPFSWMNIRPGLRSTHNSVYDAPPVIPSINTLFKLSDQFSLRASYARGFRAPSLRELYFMFFDSSHAIQGNTDLKAEYSNSFNGSLSWEPALQNGAELELIASGFYNLFKNKIDVATDPSNPNVNTYINIGNNRTAGGSLQGNLIYRNLKVSTGFLLIGRYNQYQDDPGASADLPTFSWSPELSSNLIYSFPKQAIDLNLAYKFNGRRPQYQKVTSTGAVELAHINAFHLGDFSIRKGIRNLSVAAGIKNIFDVTRVVNSSTDTGSAHSTGGPVPISYGRSYFLSLNYNFSIHNN